MDCKQQLSAEAMDASSAGENIRASYCALGRAVLSGMGKVLVFVGKSAECWPTQLLLCEGAINASLKWRIVTYDSQLSR